MLQGFSVIVLCRMHRVKVGRGVVTYALPISIPILLHSATNATKHYYIHTIYTLITYTISI